MLWVYGHYIYVYSYSAGIDFSRQNLTTKVCPRTVRVNGQDAIPNATFILYYCHLLILRINRTKNVCLNNVKIKR